MVRLSAATRWFSVAAFATIQAIEDENILTNVNEMGNYFKEKLVAFKENMTLSSMYAAKACC